MQTSNANKPAIVFSHRHESREPLCDFITSTSIRRRRQLAFPTLERIDFLRAMQYPLFSPYVGGSRGIVVLTPGTAMTALQLP
jgi:hypothetical protein